MTPARVYKLESCGFSRFFEEKIKGISNVKKLLWM